MKIFEYRGCSDLVIAEVLTDDNEETGGFKTGPVEPLIPLSEIGKTVEESNEVKYYDNMAAFFIYGEGPDTIEINGAGISVAKKAKILGKPYDETTGAMIDGPRRIRHYALGYKTQDTDGFTRYVWRYKGVFGTPAEANQTQNGGTETNTTALTYTGINTIHKFAKGEQAEDGTWKPAGVKGLVVSDREGLADLSTFFDTVTTPDTLKPKAAS